jgi:hypothetical protein
MCSLSARQVQGHGSEPPPCANLAYSAGAICSRAAVSKAAMAKPVTAVAAVEIAMRKITPDIATIINGADVLTTNHAIPGCCLRILHHGHRFSTK